MSSLPPKPQDSQDRDTVDAQDRRPQRQFYNRGAPPDDRFRRDSYNRRDDHRPRDRPRTQDYRLARDHDRGHRDYDRHLYDRNRPYDPHPRHRDSYSPNGRRDMPQRRSRSPARWPPHERRRSRSPARWPPQEQRRSRSPARWPPQEQRRSRSPARWPPQEQRRSRSPPRRPFRDQRRSRSPLRWPPQDRRPRSRSRSPKRIRLGTSTIGSRRSSPHRPDRSSRSRSRGSRRPCSVSPRHEQMSTSLLTTPEEGAITDIKRPEVSPANNSTAAQDSGKIPQAGPSLLSSQAATTQPIKDTPQDAVAPLEVSRQSDRTKSPANSPIEPLARRRSPTPPTLPKPIINDDSTVPSLPPRAPLADRQAAVVDEKFQERLPTPPPPPHSRVHLDSPSSLPHEPSPSSPKPPRPRSPPPPKQPRNHGPIGQQPGYRSPPRGPRHLSATHPRGIVTPTGPASTHPRHRRPLALLNPPSVPSPRPSTPQTQSPIPPSLPAPMEDIQSTNAPAPEEMKVPPPIIPVVTLMSSLSPDLDTEISRLRAHRAHLTSEYRNIQREARRALHELDMTTIDLRGAELRRKVADIQHDQARNGALGIDYVAQT